MTTQVLTGIFTVMRLLAWLRKEFGTTYLTTPRSHEGDDWEDRGYFDGR